MAGEHVKKAISNAKEIISEYDLDQIVGLSIDDFVEKIEKYNDVEINIYEGTFGDYNKENKRKLDVVIRNEGKSIDIIVEKTALTAEKRFIIIHELAHYLLEHIDVNVKMFDFKDELEYNEVKEQEANAFATELLIPTYFVNKLYESFSTNSEELAKVFGVTKDLMDMQLRNLGLHR